MKAIIHLATKDLRLLLRDKFGLFWVLAFPLLMALFFGSIYGGFGSGKRSSMKVIVTDYDQSEFSANLIEALDANEGLRVIRLPEDSGRGLVRRGKAVAYLIVKPGAGEFDNMFAGDSTYFVAGIDPARQAEAGFLQGMFIQAWFQVMQQSFLKPDRAMGMIQDFMTELPTDSSLDNSQKGVMSDFFGSLHSFLGQVDTGILAGPRLASPDSGADSNQASGSGNMFKGPKIELEDVATEREGPRSSWEVTFPQAALWALIGCAAAFGISIVVERTRGTLVRLRLAPISRAQILAGKGLACFIFCVGVNILLFGVAFVAFGVRAYDPLMLLLAVVSTAACFVGLMMLISVMGKTEQAVGGAGWAVLLMFSMSGGGMVPLMVMPSWMVTISHFSPVKWGILALEGAIWRGFSFGEMLVPLGILWGVGIVAFAIGVIVLRRLDG